MFSQLSLHVDRCRPTSAPTWHPRCSHTPSRCHQIIPIISARARHLTSRAAHTHSLGTRVIASYAVSSVNNAVCSSGAVHRPGRTGRCAFKTRARSGAGGRAGHQRATSADSVNDRFALDGIKMFRHFGENQIFHVNTYIFANFTQITTTFFFHYSNTYTYMMIMILTMTSTIILTQ